MLAQNARHKFSVTEYLALFEHQVLAANARTELLNGEIIELSPLGHRHAKTQLLIQTFLQQIFGMDRVFVTGSLMADEQNMPEPDVYVLYDGSVVDGNYPNAAQVEMAVEVSDTTLRGDLLNDGTGKVSIYAKADIPRVWVVDVEKQAIYELTLPQKGIYTRCVTHLESVSLHGKISCLPS